ncbi:Hypothetical Protein FCC1311_066972 [Hondaea fermentalgiana]|uniref:Uncharacterized protein n=1 Tax=Hondaea fermentalgiana TaxID=2315210 RepID=A0A2R5GL62_9STRA|nr:Hypothetical Protein FCC1311_066972 [Hondaea fermentalgiana]|eukprot:GBG30478.1 Hypothetical Protein FCC1311_066972 [Hondaea fermentalgiana]
MERLGWCQFHHPLPDKIVQLDFEGPSRCCFCTLPLPCNVHFPKIGSIIDDPRFTPLLALETEEKHAETDAHESDEIEAQSTEKQASLQENKNVKTRKMTMRSSVKLAAQKKKKPKAAFKTNEIVAAFHQNTWRYAYLLEENLNSGMLTLALKANAKPPSNTVLLVREKVRSLRGIIFETKTQSDAPAKDMISTSLTAPSASEASA